jgi:hypothetical protein
MIGFRALPSQLKLVENLETRMHATACIVWAHLESNQLAHDLLGLRMANPSMLLPRKFRQIISEKLLS